MTQLTSKYTCITQLKWQTLQVGSTLYTYIHHQIKFNVTTRQD